MKSLTPAFLMAVLATSSFSLSAAAQAGSVTTTRCSEVIYYLGDRRACLTTDAAASMSVAGLDIIIAAIERNARQIASIDPEAAKEFAANNHSAIGTLSTELLWRIRQIDFSGPSAENLNDLAAGIAQLAAHNGALTAKSVALDKLRVRLSEFYSQVKP